jgi:hypothetical protein
LVAAVGTATALCCGPCRDADFLDIRCALTAFLWADGQAAAAEDAWESLQQSQEGLGAAIYSRSGAVARVRNRWPPRATAALQAFLQLSQEGSAQDYDMQVVKFDFPLAAAAAGAGTRR